MPIFGDGSEFNQNPNFQSISPSPQPAPMLGGGGGGMPGGGLQDPAGYTQSTMPTQAAPSGGQAEAMQALGAPTAAQSAQYNPSGAKGFLGVNPLNGQPVWDQAVLGGSRNQTLEQQQQDLQTAQGIASNPFTYAQNPGSTDMYTGEFSAYNPQYAATQDTANRISGLTGGRYRAESFQNPGRNYADTFVGNQNAGAIADAIRRYGSINHPVVQQLLAGGSGAGADSRNLSSFSQSTAGQSAFMNPQYMQRAFPGVQGGNNQQGVFQGQVPQQQYNDFNRYRDNTPQPQGGGHQNFTSFGPDQMANESGYRGVFSPPQGGGSDFNPFQNNPLGGNFGNILNMIQGYGNPFGGGFGYGFGGDMGGFGGGYGFGGMSGFGRQPMSSLFSQAFMNRRPQQQSFGGNPFYSRFGFM